VRLNEIYQNYKDKIEFCCIYIREAHPDDSKGGYRTENNRSIRINFNQPNTIEERGEIAEVCILDLNLEMPMYLDGMDDDAEVKYAGWPERLYVIGPDRCIAYAGDMGPLGFYPDSWEEAIKVHAK
jgi:hypothetical protein